MSLWFELRRRNVIRVTVAYLAAVWLIMQVADLVLESFLAPAWIMQALIGASVIGFPLAVLLAWHYEWTPDGIQSADDLPQKPAVRFAGRKLDFAIITLLVLAVAFLWFERDEERGVDPNSIAVLPFSNLSPDPDNAYFAAGMHDEILNQLAKLSALSLVSRTTVVNYADSDLSIPEIARELNVANVLEGSVRFAGERIRVTMQLIDADTDEHLWSETYDRDFVDIFKIESDIAINVAKALAAEFSENERLALNDRPYDTPGAYREHLRSYADSDLALREAASLAISADADNLAAYSMRAYQGAMSFINSDRPAARLGEQQVAQMANSILSDVEHVLAQPAGPDIHLSAHLARALLYTNIWRWMEASADLELAIELSESGGSPQSLANLAWQLALIGRNGEGIGFGEKAVREWPGGAPSYAYMALGYSYLYGNRPAAALEVFRKSVEINPQMAYSRSGMLVSELVLGEDPTEPDLFEAFLASTENPTLTALYAHAMAIHGDSARALAAIARFESFENSGIAGDIDRTLIGLARGNRQEALDSLQAIIDNIEAQRPDPGISALPLLRVNFVRDPVLDEPEFVDLREQLRGR